MLIIEIKEGENIERALKRYKRKYRNVKVLQDIKEKKHFVKKSTRKRELVQKAKYKQQYLRDKEEF